MIDIGLLYAVVLFLFGCMVGSFLNVVIWRLPHGVSIIHPGSRCPGCGRRIPLLENVPILSWFLLQGRCRGCWARIHWRYPAVEFLTGLAWGLVGYAFHDLPATPVIRIATLVVLLWFISYQIAITFIDYDLTIIPDELNYSGLAVALVVSYALPHFHPNAHVWFPVMGPHFNSLVAGVIGMLVGAGSMLGVLLVGTIAFRGRIKQLQAEDPDIDTAIGFGDVKLMAFLGCFLGWREVLVAFLLGTVFGAVVGLAAKVRTGQSLIPYGPFLCAGAVLVVFFRAPLLTFFAARLAVFWGAPESGV